MVVVLLTGLCCSGKKTVANILYSLGFFEHVHIEDTLNNTSSVNTLTPSDSQNSETDHFERGAHASKLEKQFLSDYDKNFVFTSICHTSELDQLRKRPFVVAISVEAPAFLRFQRHQLHHPEACLEEFIRKDAEAAVGCLACSGQSVLKSDTGYGIEECMRLCDFHISNIGTMQNLAAFLKKKLPASPVAMVRSTFDTHFISMAVLVSLRTNCLRRTVGAVITKQNMVIATGYNGTPTGVRNCMEGGCLRCQDPTIGTGTSLESCLCVHAEANALLQAGVSNARGGTLYVTCFPCLSCAKLILQGEISRVVYLKHYSNHCQTMDLFRSRSVEVFKFTSHIQKRVHISA